MIRVGKRVRVARLADEVVSKHPQAGQAVLGVQMINEISPKYPPLARQARVEGTVVLNALIAEDGSVEKLDAASGPALLVPARRWKQ